MALNNRLAQRSGFGIIIGLLLMSTLMAWGIQESFSERSFEIHRTFVQEQDLLTNLRRTLWAMGIALRDYYLDPHSAPNEFDGKMNAMSADTRRFLTELRKTSMHREEVEELVLRFEELLNATRQAAQKPVSAADRFAFLQKEIVPRREDAAKLLRDIEKANQSSLTDSEVLLRDTRSGAANRLLIMLGACLLCGVAIAWYSIRHAERLEMESAARFQEVLQAKQQMEDLSARLMEVQEEERTRLSRELHDEIVQNLAVLKMEVVQAQILVASRAPEVRDGLARARRIADETVRSVRDISLLLRPSLLDDLGLGPALQWQAEEFTRRTGVPCHFEEQDLSEDLSGALKTCVYRVIQEALRNCEKHSTGTWVRVHVTQTPDSLEVLLEDNGKGFADAVRKPSSLGLLGMRERAYGLGGTIEIGNRTEGGAFIRMSLPLGVAATPAKPSSERVPA